MADVRIDQLTAAPAAPNASDIIEGERDPAGTPSSEKLTWTQVAGGAAFTGKYAQLASFEIEDGFACSDESTAISATGTKFQMTMPTARTITAWFACLNSACSTGTFTIDVLKNDVSVFSTTLTIDATETSTLTAATAAVVSTTAWAAGDVLKVSVTNMGDGTATGLKVVPDGTRDVS